MSVETRARAVGLLAPRFRRRRGVKCWPSCCLRSSIVFWLLLGDQLFRVGALQSMAFQLPELGILSLAMMVPLLSGGLNLSIISTANLCALTMAWVLTTHAAGASGWAWAGWQGSRLSGGLRGGDDRGTSNGFVIAYLGVSPILATLGTMTMCKGLSIGRPAATSSRAFPTRSSFSVTAR